MKHLRRIPVPRWSVACIVLVWALGVAAAGHAQLGSFAIVGDTHVGENYRVYESIIASVERHNIDTIIHVGDAINKPGSAEQWAEFFEITGPERRLYLVEGNHDRTNARTRQTYGEYFGQPYRSVAEGDTLLIFLNTELRREQSRIAGKQLVWLESELQRPFRYKFVFLHRPLFPAVASHGLDRDAAARDHLHRLFVENNVSLVVAGHDHLYQRTAHDGITYIITGGGGGTLWPFAGNGSFYHYIRAGRVNSSYVFRVVGTDEKVRDKFTVSRPVPRLPNSSE
jgi:predicted phosphodiesterase